MVVPFPPGAVADIVVRIVADGLQARLSQPVIVENAAGADGSIGTGRVAHAMPDGYTRRPMVYCAEIRRTYRSRSSLSIR